MLLKKLSLFFVTIISIRTEFTEDDSGGSGNYSGELFETQHTICQINTLQLAATAKATVTRALRGVCLSKYMDEHFKRIEKILKNHLDTIKAIETKIDSINFNKMERYNGRTSDGIVTNKISPRGTVEIPNIDEEKPLPRESEIKRLNGTVHEDGNRKKMFTYFWKIEKVKEKLSNRKSIRSINIYITPGGYCMYVKVLPTQNADTIYIQAGLTHGDFDETLLWPFRLKHRLSLMDLDVLNYIDIQSRIWDPAILCSDLHWQKPSMRNDNYECVGLAISNDVLHNRSYIHSGSLIVKLTVYLE